MKFSPSHTFAILLPILFGLSGVAQAHHNRVTLHTTSGDIVVEVDVKHAPLTARNFLKHVVERDYDRGSFYRTVTAANETNTIAPIQVIQGGASGDEASYDSTIMETTATTHLRHLNGTISMARAAASTYSLEKVNTATTEFFICIGDQPQLDFGG